jgi:hypothetical protein
MSFGFYKKVDRGFLTDVFTEVHIANNTNSKFKSKEHQNIHNAIKNQKHRLEQYLEERGLLE